MKKKSYADMDPIEEIRAIRAEIGRRFATAREYGEYLRKEYPLPDPPPEWQPAKLRPTASQKRRAVAKMAKRSAVRLRKTTAHA